MRRVTALLAVLCTGAALGALLLAVAWSGGAASPWIEETPPLDPAAAMPEIAQLREARGSILAGTSLAVAGDAAEFSAALANQTGVEPPQPPDATLVDLLRHSASDYEGHAQRLESAQNYRQADELRRLADDARRVARSLSEGDSAQASAVSRR